jgi:hypothetical protein
MTIGSLSVMPQRFLPDAFDTHDLHVLHVFAEAPA